MLQILGSPKRLCNGMTRREMLVAGGLSLLGVGLGDYLRLAEVQAQPHEPRSSIGQRFTSQVSSEVAQAPQPVGISSALLSSLPTVKVILLRPDR